MAASSGERRISTQAYQALAEALPAITWYKRSFIRYLRTALRDWPDLLGDIDFDQTKRQASDQLVDKLIRYEMKYQDATIQLMLEVAGMSDFPDLKGHEDAAALLRKAEIAVAQLKECTKQHEALVVERERLQAERKAGRQQDEVRRKFSDELRALKIRFGELETYSGTPQQRGLEFESFLNNLFYMFDLEPRLAYSLDREQIDGSLTFDTDDYILEAKWQQAPVSRELADAFEAKVRRKGKNALGLFVSVNGFSGPAIEEYSRGTSFMTLDGADLFAVLEGQIPLDDMLRRKKRHANETGECYYPTYRMFS